MSRAFTFRQKAQIVLTFGWSDFALKYRGSFLGYLWSFASPFLTFLVILHIFGPLVRDDIPYYPLYLFLGIILWQHFALTTTGCINVLFQKETIIKRIPFPRYLLLFAVGCTHCIIFCTHFVIFLVVAYFMDAPIGWTYLTMVPIAIQMTMFALGIGFFLSAFTLKYRDIEHLWTVILPVLFWLTPVMYHIDAGNVSSRVGTLSLPVLADAFISLQPLSLLMTEARAVTIYDQSIGIMHMVWVTWICLMIFLLGWYIFVKRSPNFLQEY